MSAIVTHRFRKNNVQAVFDEMCYPKVVLPYCSNNVGSSGLLNSIEYHGDHQSAAGSHRLPISVERGMGIKIISTASTGVLTAETISATIIYGISDITAASDNVTFWPPAVTSLSSASVACYSQYYIGIGKSDKYNGGLEGTDVAPGSPIPSARIERDVLNNLIALQRVVVYQNTISSRDINTTLPSINGNAGYVLPRYMWTAGTYFKAYDSTDPSCFYPTTFGTNNNQIAYPCYATYNSGSGDRLYICVKSGIDNGIGVTATVVAPSQYATTIGDPGAISSEDGYRWIYVSNLELDNNATLAALSLSTASGNTTSTLDSNQFFRIYRRTSSAASGVAAQSSSGGTTLSGGRIYSCRIVSGGSGYELGNTFNVYGDGVQTASGQVTAVAANGGAIVAVEMNTHGEKYTTGVIEMTSASTGTNAVIYPSISPYYGFGYDVTSDLPAFYAAFTATFPFDTVYPGTSDIPSVDQIRQISLIRNPVVYSGLNGITGSTHTFRCLKSLVLNTTSTEEIPNAGDIIEQYETGAKGYVDIVTTSGLSCSVYYHQNDSLIVGVDVGSISASQAVITKRCTIPFSDASFKYYKIYSKPDYVTITTGGGSTIRAVKPPDEWVEGTGQVLFVQNRVPIVQAPGQRESITVITQF